MTDSKLASAKKLLESGIPPKDVAKDLGVSPDFVAGSPNFRLDDLK